MKRFGLILLITVLLIGCTEKKGNAIYGTMTSSEIYISTEVSGRLIKFVKNEGEKLISGELIAVIDTTDIQLQLEEISASIELKKLALKGKETELEVLEQERAKLETDRDRFELLAEAEATAVKNLDDINSRLKVIELRLKQADQVLAVSRQEIFLAEIKRAQVLSRKEKYFIHSVQDGTILEKYYQVGEMVIQGKPVCKIADLETMRAKLYVSETELSYLKLGENAELLIDIRDGQMKKYSGKITSIASEAEFTPKIIQTREERVNLVYEIEVECLNDGGLKIGMPVEMLFEE